MMQETLTKLCPWEHEIIKSGYSDDMPFGLERNAPVGGDLAGSDSDFEVTEIPAYMPCGEGAHVYLWIEKIGMSTSDAAKAIENAFGVKEVDVGCAGKKDVHAVTRQWFSVQTRSDAQDPVERLNQLGRLRVLQVSRHTNKIHMGHLSGNLFGIRLTGVTADDAALSAALEHYRREGFTNYFGKQRFGFDGDNVAQGIRVIAGGRAPHWLRKIYVSAVQSAIFNLLAARRFNCSGCRVYAGDVMKKLNAGCFICDDPDTDSIRAAEGKIDITLPLIGRKYMRGAESAEQEVRRATRDFFSFWHSRICPDVPSDPKMLYKSADGARRAFLVRPARLSFRRTDCASVYIEFELPPGTYATVFLRHLCGPSFSR